MPFLGYGHGHYLFLRHFLYHKKMFSSNELQKAYPNCILISLECYQCPKTNDRKLCLINENTYKYKWLQTIECNLCRNTWFICKSCIVKRRFRKRSQILSHNKNFHSIKGINTISKLTKNVKDCNIPVLLSSKEIGGSVDEYEDIDTINNQPVHHTNEFFSNLDDNKTNRQYFIARYNSLFQDINQIDVQSSDENVPMYIENANSNNVDNNVEMFQYWLAKGKPFEYLSGRSLFNKFSGYESISRSTSILNLKLFSFINSLTNNQKKDFADILNSVRPEMIKNSNEQLVSQPADFSNPNGNCNQTMILPTSMKSIRSIYIDGTNSLKKILPFIKVEMVGVGDDEHSCVSFRDCINHYILFGGYRLKKIQNHKVAYSENMFTSKEFERNLNISINGLDHYRPMVIIPFSLFSDDFDPTVSIVTANRKGIWIYTCSFKSQDEFDNEISKTYILAMGNKGANHQPILKKIENEINTFRLPNKSDMFYHNILQKKLTVISFPLVRHGDQPERRGINYLKLGKQSNHARWRHSLDIKNAGNFLPSCLACKEAVCLFFKQYDSNRSLKVPGLTCSQCTNWNFDPDHTILHTYPARDFPHDQLPNNGKLPPLLLTKEKIKKAINLSYEKMKYGEWTKSNVKTYLNYFCVKTSIVEDIVEKGKNAHLLHLLTERQNNDMQELSLEENFILEDQKHNPNLYNNIPLSFIMEVSMDDIDSYPDSPMHLLSGYVKATMHLMFLYLKKIHILNLFSKY